MAIDPCHQRQPAGIHPAQQPGDIVARIGRLDGEGRSVGIRLEIAAGAEGLVAGSGEDDGAHFGISLGLVERSDDPLGDRFVQGVATTFAIDRDDQRRALASGDDLFAHGFSSLRSSLGSLR